MDSSGFSSPRPDCFPAGLRVLVVDDDPTWLKILEKMLKKCQYEVTTCNLAREALDLLRERKDGFDIVISDVNMPDMDGFKLLEHVGLEMDLPVIMMSVDGETSRVMKGVQHGACDYLLKPIRMKELRNIWQHVFRKKIHEVRDIEGYESLEEIQMMRNATELSEDGFMFSGDFVSGKKRKDSENKHIDDRMSGGDSSSAKKARVIWTYDLHQKFVKAVHQIGFEKVGPKKILDLMGVPWLTRENVASHLQKYRLYLSRLQKEDELKATFGGTKHSDISSKDFTGNVCPITTLQHNALPDENYAVPGPKITTHHDMPKIDETNLSKRSGPLGESNDLVKSSTPTISYDHSCRLLDSDVKPEPKIQVQYSWSASVPPPQFKQEHKARFQENGFDRLPRPVAKTNPGTPNDESSDKPPYNNRSTTKPESTTTLFSIQPETHHAINPTPSPLWNTKNHSLDHNPFDLPEYSQRNSVIGPASTIRLWDEGFVDYSPPVDLYQPNAYLGSLDPLLFANQDLLYDVSHDLLKFDPEYPSDMVEYPVINQGVPI